MLPCPFPRENCRCSQRSAKRRSVRFQPDDRGRAVLRAKPVFREPRHSGRLAGLPNDSGALETPRTRALSLGLASGGIFQSSARFGLRPTFGSRLSPTDAADDPYCTNNHNAGFARATVRNFRLSSLRGPHAPDRDARSAAGEPGTDGESALRPPGSLFRCFVSY